MLYLIDSSVLVRTLHAFDPDSTTAREALRKLSDRRDTLCVIPQVVAEFWAVATRPRANNGLGFTPERVNRSLTRYREAFELHFETRAVYEGWRRLALDQHVRGKQTHDARLAAAVLAHGIDRILTFNTKHFGRYSIEVVHPADL